MLGKMEEKGVSGGWGEGGESTEDEMVGWHYQLNGHEFQQTLGYNKEQGSLAVMQSTGSKKGTT